MSQTSVINDKRVSREPAKGLKHSKTPFRSGSLSDYTGRIGGRNLSSEKKGRLRVPKTLYTHFIRSDGKVVNIILFYFRYVFQKGLRKICFPYNHEIIFIVKF